MAKSAKREDLLEIGKKLYFPDGKSKKGMKASSCTFTICDFSHSSVDDDMTMGEFYDSSGLSGVLRYYIHTTGPGLSRTTQDIESDSDAAINDAQTQ